MFCSTDFPVCHLKLAPGDSLFLYTDGLSEIFNNKGDEYGLCRVEDLVARHASKPPDQMLSACLNEMRDFSSGVKRTDDLTLLVMQHSN
jgi:sigma-B regulation protein RsbU (phosphoserine phosphatase)